nr:restriction endonuclease [uncultured Methanospirillum sp.]
MAEYDLKSLSPREFESLAQRILQEELKISLKKYKQGPDLGVDAWGVLSDEEGEIIVQCKHYLKSGYSKLRKILQKEETVKIKIHKPKRYIVFTSCPLSFGNAEELVEILSPFCIGKQDIYGFDDIQSLLQKYEDIVKDFPSLWYISEQIFQQILNQNIYFFTESGIDQINSFIKRFVRTNNYVEIKNAIGKNNVCIVSGEPGVGKTTIAKILSLHYRYLNYEVIQVSKDIEEGFRTLNKNPQFFLCDDFLGQCSIIEKLSKNEEDRLLNFIDIVQKREKKISFNHSGTYLQPSK